MKYAHRIPQPTVKPTKYAHRISQYHVKPTNYPSVRPQTGFVYVQLANIASGVGWLAVCDDRYGLTSVDTSFMCPTTMSMCSVRSGEYDYDYDHDYNYDYNHAYN